MYLSLGKSGGTFGKKKKSLNCSKESLRIVDESCDKVGSTVEMIS